MKVKIIYRANIIIQEIARYMKQIKCLKVTQFDRSVDYIQKI